MTKTSASGDRESDARDDRATIVIIDDHAIVRQGLELLIEREPDLCVVGEAEDGREGLASIETHKPDLVVLDLSLGLESGLSVLREIGARFPAVKVLVLSMLSEVLYAEQAFKAGARGYVMKQSNPRILLEALRCVLKGEVFMSPTLAQHLALRSIASGEESTRPVTSMLTSRELEVFEGIGRGFSPAELADALSLSVKTIGTYRERIKRKLGLSDSRELAHYAVEWMRSLERR